MMLRSTKLAYQAIRCSRRVLSPCHVVLCSSPLHTATSQCSNSSPEPDDNTTSKKESSPSATSPTAVAGGFAKAMAKIEGHESFPKALRFSSLVQMGDPEGKIAEGVIVHVVDDDLYIDFGTKFNCVCPRPNKNGSAYTLGKKVRVMVHDLELSTRFLGAKTDLTILEADCTLLGLARSARDESLN